MVLMIPGHFHTTNDYVGRSGYSEPRNFGVGTDGNANSSGDTNTKTTGITIQNAGTGITIQNAGSGNSHENRPSILCPLLHYEDLTPGSKSTIIYG